MTQHQDLAPVLAAARRYRITLTDAAAARRIELAHGDIDRVLAELHTEHLERVSRAFVAEYRRLERSYYQQDAWARHAAFAGALVNGTLGWRAQVLLIAADDAKLNPGAQHYRTRLTAIVDQEIQRRFPTRRQADWQVVDPDSRHGQLLQTVIRDETLARELVLDRKPELAQRIDALSSQRLQRDVRGVLNKITKRLQGRISRGWTPNPERYQQEVIQAAHAYAWSHA